MEGEWGGEGDENGRRSGVRNGTGERGGAKEEHEEERLM